jgi:hypothetical protein
MELSPPDLAELRHAKALLTADNLAVRISGLVGGQMNRGLDWLLHRLPAGARDGMESVAQDAARRALEQGYRTALATVDAGEGRAPRWAWLSRRLSSLWFDKAATAATGFAGGAAGLAGTALELPVTTAILLRAIAQIAAREGEDVRSDECRIECIKVLAFGAPAAGEDAGYWTVRLALSQAIGGYAGRTIGELMPRVIAQVLPRFGVNVTWKFAGQAVPLAGAATGALMNVAFTDHFQEKARGHFIVRRLERAYGEAAVREAYDAA